MSADQTFKHYHLFPKLVSLQLLCLQLAVAVKLLPKGHVDVNLKMIIWFFRVFTNQSIRILVSDTLEAEEDYKISSDADSGWRILQKLFPPNENNLTSGTRQIWNWLLMP